jgi:hypothetical protein
VSDGGASSDTVTLTLIDAVSALYSFEEPNGRAQASGRGNNVWNSKMAETNFDTLVKVLATSKAVFWQENKDFPESEIQRLWQLRWNCLGSRVEGTSEKHGFTVPCKRASPRTMSVSGQRPSKRQELVGPPLSLSSYPWSDRIFRVRQHMPLSDKPRPRLERRQAGTIPKARQRVPFLSRIAG